MFGYLRFILAVMVMLSHTGVRVYGLNQGVIAVVIFYILAGFVVSYLFTDIIPNHNILYFYRDRVKRIFPLYLSITAITTLFLLFTNYGNPHFTPLNILTNLTIIPLNYYMLLDNTILTNPSWWLIPPAWSLGTELQAYIILPFALLYPKFRYAILVISLLIYMLANLTLIHSDYFGYRLIIGVIFIFLIGSTIQKISTNAQNSLDIRFLLSIYMATIVLISIVIYLNLTPTYAKETAIGIVVGTPLVYILSMVKIKLPLNSFLGSLSYALFLSHFLAIWIVDYLSIAYSKLLYIVSIALLISLLAIYIEKKIKK